MPMSLKLEEIDSRKVLFDYKPSEKQWWITGFDPSNQNAQANNLKSTVTIDFSGNDNLYAGFYDLYNPDENSKSLWEFNGKIATLTW